jgi:hypothetical protein
MIILNRRQLTRINTETQPPSVVHGVDQLEIRGIDPPAVFRCGGKIYTECQLPYIKTLMDREWETGLIDGRDQ